MTRKSKIIEKEDLIQADTYAKNRKQFRKKLLDLKKDRRVSLGPHATFYFENFDTMLAQIQEMMYIEKGGEEQLKDELNAYNPLVPKGEELVATLMFEIDNPILRAEFLGKVGGIEEKVYLQVNNEKIMAIPEKDVDRTSSEGKASSVQFLHFNFNQTQIEKIKNLENEITIGIEHSSYDHIAKLSEDTKSALIKDSN